jgi:hypothetical protein
MPTKPSLLPDRATGPSEDARQNAKVERVESHSPSRSAEFRRLTELRAYKIWVQSGRPKGAEGEAVKEKNWHEAERQIEKQVNDRAFQYWERQGRPQGAEGEAVSIKNRQAAEEELLKETEADLRRHPID